jgi:hypothetical protein
LKKHEGLYDEKRVIELCTIMFSTVMRMYLPDTSNVAYIGVADDMVEGR